MLTWRKATTSKSNTSFVITNSQKKNTFLLNHCPWLVNCVSLLEIQSLTPPPHPPILFFGHPVPCRNQEPGVESSSTSATLQSPLFKETSQIFHALSCGQVARWRGRWRPSHLPRSQLRLWACRLRCCSRWWLWQFSPFVWVGWCWVWISSLYRSSVPCWYYGAFSAVIINDRGQ